MHTKTIQNSNQSTDCSSCPTGRPSEELDELQTIEITSPQGIAAHKAAHKDERVIVETLAIQPSAVCTPSSIEISWVPPTRNVDRIVGYKVMLATTLGIVKQVGMRVRGGCWCGGGYVEQDVCSCGCV